MRCSPRAGSPRERRVILAVQENLVPGDSVAGKLAFALAAGFDGLELRDAGPQRLPRLVPLHGRVPSVCPELDGWLGDFDARAAAARSTRCPPLDGVADARRRAA